MTTATDRARSQAELVQMMADAQAEVLKYGGRDEEGLAAGLGVLVRLGAEGDPRALAPSQTDRLREVLLQQAREQGLTLESPTQEPAGETE